MRKFIIIGMIIFVLFLLFSCDKAEPEEEVNIYFSVKKDGKFGAINSDGEEVIPFVYDDLSPFTNKNIALATNSEGMYLINEKNEVIISSDVITFVPQYHSLFGSNYSPSRPEFFQITLDDQKIIYDQAGTIILTLDLEDEIAIINDLVNVTIDNNNFQMFIDHVDESLFDDYTDVTIAQGMVFASNETNLFFLDENYDVLVEIENAEDYVRWTDSDAVIVMKDMKEFAYTKQGQVIGDQMGYEYIDKISDYIVFENNEGFGVDDLSGQEIIPAIYSDIVEINGYFAAIKADESADFYHEETLLFSKDDVVFSMFYELFDQKYMLYQYDESVITDSSYVIVDENGTVLADPYQHIFINEDATYPIVRDENHNLFLIDEDLDTISDPYVELTYNDRGFYFGRKSVDDVVHYEVMNADGQIIHTFDGGTFFDGYSLFFEYEDISTISTMYYLDDDLNLIDIKHMNYESLFNIIEARNISSMDKLIVYMMFERAFEYVLSDQDYVFENQLEHGYALASINDAYVIVHFNRTILGNESFEAVAEMPYYDFRDLYRSMIVNNTK